MPTPDNLEALRVKLDAAGIQVPDAATFKQKYSNEDGFKTLYDKLNSANIEVPDYDTFKQKYFTATAPEKKNTGGTGSNQPVQQQQGVIGQSGTGIPNYEWTGGEKAVNEQEFKMATGGVQGMNYQPMFSAETAEKMNGRSPNVYVADKANEQMKLSGDFEAAKTKLQSLNYVSNNFMNFMKMADQLKNLHAGTPEYNALVTKIQEQEKLPFDIRAENWDESRMTQDQLRKQKLPADLQDLKTVGDAVQRYGLLHGNAVSLQNKIQGVKQDISDVVTPMREVHGITVNKNNVHELGVYSSFLNGLLSNVSNIATAASLIGASDDRKQQIYKDAIGAQIIDPAQPASEPAKVAGTAGNLAPYFLPGMAIENMSAGAAIKTLGSNMVNGLMMGLNNYYESGLQAYKATLDKTGDEAEALKNANGAAKTGGVIGGITGSVALPLSGMAGEHIGLGALTPEAVEKAMVDGKLKLGQLSAAEYMAYSLPKNAVANVPFGAGQIIDNIFARQRGEDRGYLDNVANTYFSAMLVGHAVDGLVYAGDKLPGDVRNVYENTVAKYAYPQMQEAVNNATTTGQIQPTAGLTATMQRMQDKADAFAAMRGMDLTPDQEQKILPLVMENNQLLKQIKQQEGRSDGVSTEAEQAKVEENKRQINEIRQAPLTDKEKKDYNDLQQRQAEAAKDAEAEKLNDLEKARLAHYDKRTGTEPVTASEEKGQSAAPEQQATPAQGEPYTKEGMGTIITHPESDDSAKGLVNTNDSDNPEIPNDKLTERGKEQAAAIDLRGKKVFVSPNERTEQTYNAAQKDEATEKIVTPLLKTGDVGTGEKLPEKNFDDAAWIKSPQADEFKQRMQELYTLRQQNPDAVFLTHSKVQRAQEALDATAGPRTPEGGLNAEQPKVWTDATTEKFVELGNTAAEREQRTAGISHAAMEKAAAQTGTEAPERGQYVSPEQAIEQGRQALRDGADPQKAVDAFNDAGAISKEGIALVRAKTEELTRAAHEAYDKFGEGSKEDRAAREALSDWQKSIKPMMTAWGNIGTAMQGATDIDTGSYVGMRAAYEAEHGKEMSAVQKEQAKQQVDKINDLTNKVTELEKKLSDAIDKRSKEPGEPQKSYTERSKALADKVRRLKTKPLTFKDENGNEIEFKQNAAVPYNEIVEGVAQAIEAGGRLADAVKATLEKYKNDDWYKNLNDNDKNRLADALTTHLTPEADDDIITRFADKTDNKFTAGEAKSIWDYAKENYLDKGSDFLQMVRGVATDLGLSPEQVRDALGTNKSERKLTDELYLKQAERRRAVDTAKEWIKNADRQNDSAVVKAARALGKLPDLFFAIKTAGHGTVAPITHAGMDAFRPSNWDSYFKFFMEGFKNAYGNKAEYEKRMADLQSDPMYGLAKRSGLAVDPNKKYDEYQQAREWEDTRFGKALKWFNQIGDRGFDALKIYRLEQFKKVWENLSEAEKADPETAKEIAKIINHSTGTSDFSINNETATKVLSTLFFAPKLEASRWSALIKEPAQALGTLSNWQNSSSAEKAAAKLVVRRSAEMLGTTIALLYANQSLLRLAGSKQQINWTNPTEQDWLKFKGFNKTFDLTGGRRSTMSFIGNMLALPFQSKKDLHGTERSDKLFENIGRYLRGKLSPIAGTAFDFGTHKDFEGNVLPPFDDKPRGDKKHLSWSEYLALQQVPIPITEAVKTTEKSMEDRGMKKAEVRDVLTGIFWGTVTGATGARVGDEPKKKK